MWHQLFHSKAFLLLVVVFNVKDVKIFLKNWCILLPQVSTLNFPNPLFSAALSFFLSFLHSIFLFVLKFLFKFMFVNYSRKQHLECNVWSAGFHLFWRAWFTHGSIFPSSLLFLLHLFPSEQQWRNLEEKEKRKIRHFWIKLKKGKRYRRETKKKTKWRFRVRG